MRVYYVHLQRGDFSLDADGVTWQSNVIDLYNNSTYKNYSVVRSNYGLGAIEPVMGATPNNVWVGMEVQSTTGTGFVTDTGFVENGRYIDTSGQINLVSYNVTTPEYSSTVTLDVYESADSTSIFPAEWTGVQGRTIIDGLSDQTDVTRYAVLVLHWNYDPGNIDFYMRVEIDGPVMGPRYGETQALLRQLPTWMAMSESGYAPATPELAVNQSIGGSFLNAIAGQWLDDLVSQVTYRQLQLFIDTADITQMAWCYRSVNNTDYLYSFIGDGTPCVVSYSDDEFYKAQPGDDVVYWDETNQLVFSNALYNNFEINGVTYSQELHQIWNSFDDLGLLVNLDRLPNEGNVSFRLRILDVYQNQPGVGIESFKFALRRELNLWQFYGSTPDSSFVGATPNVLEIADLEVDPLYVNTNGLPTQKFVNLANYLASQYPTTWGQFRWNAAYSDLTNTSYEGYNVLPLMMDATPWADPTSGVGDSTDLLLLPPSPGTGPHPFQAQFILRGIEEVPQTQYPPVEVAYTIQGQGNKLVYQNPVTTVWFTLVFEQYGTSEVDYYSFQLSSTSDVSNGNATPTAASIASFTVFDADGSTNKYATLYNMATGNPTGSRIFSQNLSSVALYVGEWDPVHQVYTNVPVANTFNAWFSTNPADVIVYNTAGGTLSETNNSATPSELPFFFVQMQSVVVDTVASTWLSPQFNMSTTINSTGNLTTTQSTTVAIPNVNWDPYITGGKQYIVTLDSITVLNVDGSTKALPLNGSISIDGTTVNTTINISGTTTSLVLAALTSAGYPVTGSAYTSFTAYQTNPISGTVDENGPWVNGFPSASANSNYILENVSLSLSSFGISNSTTNILPNWIGVQTIGDEEVVTWIESNTPVVGANGQLATIPLYVQLQPAPAPQWNPRLHSGTYFENNTEGYFYVAGATQNFGPGGVGLLNSAAQQGAPVVVSNAATPSEQYRQVAFFDWNSATPSLGLMNVEQVTGTNASVLYASFPNIQNLTITDVTDSNHTFAVQYSSVESNQITTVLPTSVLNTYELSYELTNSFYIDNNYQATPNSAPQALVVCSNTAPFYVAYETSQLSASTPINLPLNAFYTAIDEGFIFLSHEDYPFSYVLIKLTPSTIVADGEDYALASFYAYDEYNNPKQDVSFQVSCLYSTVSTNVITTDRDGHAVAYITAPANNNNAVHRTDTLSVVNAALGYNLAVNFNLQEVQTLNNVVRAIATQNSIRANGTDMNLVYGMVTDIHQNPIPYANVNWAQARTAYDLFSGTGYIKSNGSVQANSSGQFSIGPFTAHTVPGYWLVSVSSSNSATPSTNYTTVGDVAFWLEYPDNYLGQANINDIPNQVVQLATPVTYFPAQINSYQHPVYYNDANPVTPATPNETPNWTPPAWYPMPAFDQWQLGIYNTTGTALDWSSFVASNFPPHPTIGEE